MYGVRGRGRLGALLADEAVEGDGDPVGVLAEQLRLGPSWP